MAPLAALPSGGANTSPQPPKTTAQVLEFICLFTHDLVKKQKRWQDGRAKFHTFNKRVMVYDEKGYSIGDMHWREDYDFGEGEELRLERGSAIVQIGECVRSSEQDISELVDKRLHDKEQRAAKIAARTRVGHSGAVAAAGSYPVAREVPADHFQMRQTPLNQLLGTPTGHYGRAAAPSQSPFEQRRREAARQEDDTTRPAKRPRREPSPPSKLGYAQNLFGTKLCLSSQPPTSTWQRPSRPLLASAPRVSQKPSVPENSVPITGRAAQNTSSVPVVIESDKEDDEPVSEVHEVAPARARTESKPRAKKTSNTKRGNAKEPLGAESAARIDKPDKPTEAVQQSLGTAAAILSVDAARKPTTISAKTTQEVVDLDSRAPKRSARELPEGNSAEAEQVEIAPRKRQRKTKANSSLNTNEMAPAAPKLQAPNPEPSTGLGILEQGVEENPKKKTALRIKSKQKRGLLVLSANEGVNNLRGKAASKDEEGRTTKEDDLNPSSRDKPDKSQRKPASSRNESVSQSSNHVKKPTLGGVGGGEEFSDGTTKPARARASKKRASRRTVLSDDALELEETESCPPARMETQGAKSGMKPGPHAELVDLVGSDNDSDESVGWMPRPENTKTRPSGDGPGSRKQQSRQEAQAASLSGESKSSATSRGLLRLAKLGRKSVKSREVIGFVSDRPLHNPFGQRAAPPPPIASQATVDGEEEASEGNGFDVPVHHAAEDGIPTSSELAQIIECPSKGWEPTPEPGETETEACINKDVSERQPPMAQAMGDEDAPAASDLEALLLCTPLDLETPPVKETVEHKEAGGEAAAAEANDKPQDATTQPGPGRRTLRRHLSTAVVGSALSPAKVEAVRSLARINSLPLGGPGAGPSGADALAEAAKTKTPAGPAAQPTTGRPRIANPATRGRKAAVKSDARGKAPQHVLPADAGPVARQEVLQAAVAMLAAQSANEAAALLPPPPLEQPPPRPKITMKFPGFASAGSASGPWSRESYDLLGMGRPAR